MKRGFIILALGHHYYGKLALNLAVSIRNGDKNIPVALVYAGDGIKTLEKQELEVFSQIIPAPLKSFSVDGVTKWIRTKLFTYDLSPFDETIYLDADMIWLLKRTPSQLFEELAAVDFTMINEGFQEGVENANNKYTHWAAIKDIREAYPEGGENRIYQLRSEMMYFKKTELNNIFFDLAKEIYDHPKIKVDAFSGALPDEFAFNIASYVLGHYPHRDKWSPVFWEFMHKEKRNEPGNVYDNFYAYSVGGNVLKEGQRNLYNNIIKFCFSNARMKHPHLLHQYNNKRDFLKEREKI